MLILQLFIGISLLIALSWMFSFLVIYDKKINTLENFILRTVIGSLIFATLIALMITKGNTMLLLSIPILLIFIKVIYKKNLSLTLFSKLNLLALTILIIVACSLVYLNVRGIDFKGLKVPINDQSFYCSIANCMYYFGNESSIGYLESLYNVDKMTIPYHYYEYWLAVGLRYITGWNMHILLNGIVSGFSLIQIFSVLYLILKLLPIRNEFIIICGAILFIAFRGLFHYLPSLGLDFAKATDSIFFDGNQKLIYSLPFFLFSIYFFLREKNTIGLIFLLLLPAINIVFLPSIFIAIGLFICYKLIALKFNLIRTFKENIDVIIASILLLIVFAFYMKFISMPISGSSMVKSIGGIIFNLIINGGKWLLINSILLIFVLFFIVKKTNRKYIDIFVILIFLVSGGLISYAVFDSNQNAWQLYATITRFGVYGIFILLLFLVKYSNKILISTYLTLIGLSILMFIENYPAINYLSLKKISSFSPNYINEIGNQKFTNKVGIKFVNVENRPNLQRNPIYAGICNYFSVTENAISTVVLNATDLFPDEYKNSFYKLKDLEDNQLGKEIISMSPFLKFANFKDNILNDTIIKEKQIQFIKKFKPEFCIIEKGVEIPNFLSSFIDKIILDEGTKEQFILLKY